MVDLKNKKAYHDYFVDSSLEVGLCLRGNEVKSIRAGKCNIKGAWATIQNNELVLRGMHIHKWETSNVFDVDEDREIKLLAHKREISKLVGLIKQKGYSLIPISMYFKGNFVKIELGIGKGKKLYDKRRDIAKKDAEMRMRKAKNL